MTKRDALVPIGIVIGGVAIFFFTLFILFIVILLDDDGAPSDKELQDQLMESQGHYVQLIKMLREDIETERISYISQSPSKSIDTERLKEYRYLFEELNIEKGIRKGNDNSIRFINFSRGISISGESKGLIFQPHNPSPLLTSLDDVSKEIPEGTFAYKKINNDWYIYYFWNS
jgi:hypothetical protein